ncbi:N-acetylgalactosamine-6-sulfatase [Persicobacter diffluens]|uniref:N-acetylgalactosamine-6-sulfatase n=2 Tax=Persicobacter diffluens TaxID=981 RepID=A0AAN5APA4_9BACT|nr:N-acetylgalactosamine-6-sulfatase [Persicobacter diffluens]
MNTFFKIKNWWPWAAKITLLIALIVGLLIRCQPPTQKATAEAEKPNIIFILTDDLGAGDLGCTGHPYAQTPNIDQLAIDGVRFTKAYMSASWCAPSRYGLMRGQYPSREFYGTRNLMPEQPSVTKMLKEAGYATAHFGKWHMNIGKKYSNSPSDFGIDEHLTILSGGPTWSKEERKDPYFRAKSTDKYVDLTMDFIQKQSIEKDNKPFYVNLWVAPTHSYIDPTPEQLSVYKNLKVNLEDFKNPWQREFLEFVGQHGDINKSMQAYCADLTALDKAVGRLMTFLKENGLEENTMIVFSSDNGPGPLTFQVEEESVVERYKKMPTLLNNVGSSGDYRDRKLSVHDGGIRVPLIVKWPKNAPKGKVDTETTFVGVDWLPTVASICGIDLPEANYDGHDLKTAFSGKAVKRETPVFWSENDYQKAVLSGNYKGTMNKAGEFFLYNIENDPGEHKDLKSIETAKAEEVKSLLDNYLATVPDMEQSKAQFKAYRLSQKEVAH